MLIVAFAMLFSSPTSAQATLEVLTNLDSPNATCPPTGANQFCTLREAIAALGNGDDIIFNIPGAPPATIALNTNLPPITANNVTINAGNGVVLSRRRAGAVSGLTIEGNGATILGFTSIQGFRNAIYVNDAANVTIGGAGPILRNTLIGNTNAILIEGDNADNATIIGNLIGIDNGGNVTPNSNGIVIRDGADNAQIGNGGFAGSNTISGNGGYGIYIDDGDNHNIGFNFIGFDSLGSAPISNGRDGISILNSSGNTISNNTIGSNRRHGMLLANVTNTTITNNRVGVPLFPSIGLTGNRGDGIRVAGLTSDLLTITGNTIGTNRGAGVRVSRGTRVRISNNSISSNGGLGIDLGGNGVRGNDLRDRDGGANFLQNYPVLENVFGDGATPTILEGTLNSTPNSNFTIEVYYNTVCDRSGFGEGDTRIGVFNVGTDANGNADFSQTFGAFASGFITAIAIDANGNTSEFSRCIEILAEPPIADFRPIPARGLAPLDVFFEDRSTGIITTYEWDFECDGIVDSNAQEPTFIYTVPGIYEACLTVIGPGGTSPTVRRRIVVLDDIPPTDTPDVPTLPPGPTATFTLTPTLDGTLPTSTPTLLALPSATATIIPSQTSTATDLPTATQTLTLVPSATATIIPSQTSTATDLPTATQTLTLVPSATATLLPTQTSTVVPTITALPTQTTPPEIEVEKVSDGDDEMSIDIDNESDEIVDDVVVVEELREEVVFIASVPGAPTCIEDEGVVTCTFGDLPPGGSLDLDITVDSNGANPDSGITTVTSNGNIIEILDEPYILKLGQPPIAGPGDEVIYTIRVINPTDETVRRIRVEDALPFAVEIIDSSSTSGVVRTSGQFVLFTQASLAPGEVVIVVIRTRVREEGQFNQIINEACLTSLANDNERCAQMQFLRASQLPDTGEPSLLPTIVQRGIPLLGMISVVSVLVGLAYGGISAWSKHRV